MLDAEPVLYALANLISDSSMQAAPRRAVVLTPVHIRHAGPAAGSCSDEVDAAYSRKNRVNHWRVKDQPKTHS